RFRSIQRSPTPKCSGWHTSYAMSWRKPRRDPSDHDLLWLRAAMLAYLAIYAAAILEGEIYYSKVCADAMSGRLSWIGVLVAGALGGATGDQIWFYLLRRRIHWLDRFPRLGRYRDRVIKHVHSREARSEEHTSELQSHLNLVCRLLLEKKKINIDNVC